MSQNQSQTVMEIMRHIDGITLREKKGARFRYPLHLTKRMSETLISELDLGVRAYNSVKRAGYNTIGELANSLADGSDLGKIRGCGKTSIREIMEHLFCYQYNSLPVDKKETYLKEVIILNLMA